MTSGDCMHHSTSHGVERVSICRAFVLLWAGLFPESSSVPFGTNLALYMSFFCASGKKCSFCFFLEIHSWMWLESQSTCWNQDFQGHLEKKISNFFIVRRHESLEARNRTLWFDLTYFPKAHMLKVWFPRRHSLGGDGTRGRWVPRKMGPSIRPLCHWECAWDCGIQVSFFCCFLVGDLSGFTGCAFLSLSVVLTRGPEK